MGATKTMARTATRNFQNGEKAQIVLISQTEAKKCVDEHPVLKTALKSIGDTNKVIQEIKDSIKEMDKRMWYIVGGVVLDILVKVIFK